MRQQVMLGAAVVLSLTIMASTSSQGADQSVTGAGNQAAQQLANRSSLVSSAMALITQRIGQIGDATLRNATFDAVTNPLTCLAHRARLTEKSKAELLQELLAQGLVDPADEGMFPGGLKAGVYPPVTDEGDACPHLPQPYLAAPGSFFWRPPLLPGWSCNPFGCQSFEQPQSR
jgi:hypothetical protein